MAQVGRMFGRPRNNNADMATTTAQDPHSLGTMMGNLPDYEQDIGRSTVVCRLMILFLVVVCCLKNAVCCVNVLLMILLVLWYDGLLP